MASEPMDLDTPYDHQNISPPRCPAFRGSGSHSGPNNFHPAFQSPAQNYTYFNQLPNQLPNPTGWDYSVNHQPLQPPFSSTLNNRFQFPFDPNNQPGRARELAFFDNFHNQGDSRQQQSHPSTLQPQPQQPHFHDSQTILFPGNRNMSSNTQNGSNTGEGPSSTPQRPQSLVVSSNYSSTRSDLSSGSTDVSSISPARENGPFGGQMQLPPPTGYNGFPDQWSFGMGRRWETRGYPEGPSYDRETGRPASYHSQAEGWDRGNRAYPAQGFRPPPRMPPLHPPFPSSSSPPRQAPVRRTERDSQPALSSAYEFDSEDYDSTDEGEQENETHRRTAATYARQYGAVSGRGYQDEAAAERARAARRAQQASVKFVASAAALSSFEKVDIDILTGDEKNCIICYNDFGVMNPDGHIESPVRLPKCKHVFGDFCIKQWLKDSDSCPYCRDKLPSEPKQDPRRAAAAAAAAARDAIRVAAASDWNGATLEDRERILLEVIHRREELAGIDLTHTMLDIRARRPNDLLTINAQQSTIPTETDYYSRQSLGDRYMGDRIRGSRGRHSSGATRAAAQINLRPSGTNTSRVVRNYQQPHMRMPISSGGNNLDVDSGTSQQRSITPYPNGQTSWGSQQTFQPTSSGRPSSLPNERSPLGQASENSQTNTTAAPFATMGADRPTNYEDWTPRTSATSNRDSVYPGSVSASGRPASAEFVNEMPSARQAALENMFGHHYGQNERGNATNGDNNVQMPPRQNDEFHQQLPPTGFS